jgi:hypothetical protein
VEILDSFFTKVTELDIVLNFHKVFICLWLCGQHKERYVLVQLRRELSRSECTRSC